MKWIEGRQGSGYFKKKLFLSKLDLCNANLIHIKNGNKHHFMRIHEFDFCEKWGLNDNTKT